MSGPASAAAARRRDPDPDPWLFPGADDAAGRRRGRRFGLFFSAIWLFYLGYPVITALSSLTGWARVLVLVDLAVFAAGYVGLLRLAWGQPVRLRVRVALFAALVALVVIAALLLGASGLVAGVYLVSGAAVLFRGRAGLALSAGVVVAALVAMTAPALRDWGTALSFGLVFVIMRVVAANIARSRELSVANDEIARLAVSEERLRFSRDLHDILGHSLTAISVKAGLAERLLELDPARAAAEVADVERLAREALADVRETVSGYRGVSLLGELARARQALAAAGIDAELPGAVDEVPGTRRELFGWVVREGVTNVVRHSGARRCMVAVSPDSVSVTDDGTGCPGGAGAGSGLAGLRERVGSAGGRLQAEPGPDGGFRLSARIPA